MVLGAVQSAISGMKDAAVAAGFDTFEGALSGPSGRVTFRVNLKTGAWSFSGSSNPADDLDPVKEASPNSGEQ